MEKQGAGRKPDRKHCIHPRERESKRKKDSRPWRERVMKALLLLVLPWLSPANYTDNVGNLHILYSEL